MPLAAISGSFDNQGRHRILKDLLFGVVVLLTAPLWMLLWLLFWPITVTNACIDAIQDRQAPKRRSHASRLILGVEMVIVLSLICAAFPLRPVSLLMLLVAGIYAFGIFIAVIMAMGLVSED